MLRLSTHHGVVREPRLGYFFFLHIVGSIHDMTCCVLARVPDMQALAGSLTKNLLASPVLEPTDGGNVGGDAHKDQGVILVREALWIESPQNAEAAAFVTCG